MDERKKTPERNATLRELLFLIVCGCFFLAAIFAWRHYHPESDKKEDLEAQEKAQRLFDH
jgi:hypothetical protein